MQQQKYLEIDKLKSVFPIIKEYYDIVDHYINELIITFTSIKHLMNLYRNCLVKRKLKLAGKVCSYISKNYYIYIKA